MNHVSLWSDPLGKAYDETKRGWQRTSRLCVSYLIVVSWGRPAMVMLATWIAVSTTGQNELDFSSCKQEWWSDLIKFSNKQAFTSVESPASGMVTCKIWFSIRILLLHNHCNQCIGRDQDHFWSISAGLILGPIVFSPFVIWEWSNSIFTPVPRLLSQVRALESSWFVGASVSGSAVTYASPSPSP